MTEQTSHQTSPRSFRGAGGLGLAAAATLFLAAPFTTLRLGEAERRAAEQSESDVDRGLRNQSAIAVILGEFRVNASDLIFIKTERYLHSGVAYEPHLDMVEMEKSGTIKALSSDEKKPVEKKPESPSHAHDHSHDQHGHDHDEEVVSVIKPPEEDFRGFVGHLEREVKPWLPPGSPDRHTSGTELLPWYRLATLTNPRNERAYMVGAWWLKGLDSDEQTEEAIRFLDEGVVNNPQSFQLYMMRGSLERQLGREETACRDFLKAAELAAEIRPPGGEVSPEWTLHQEEQSIGALSMSVLCTRDVQSPQAALDLVERLGRKMNGVPPVLERLKVDLELNARNP